MSEHSVLTGEPHLFLMKVVMASETRIACVQEVDFLDNSLNPAGISKAFTELEHAGYVEPVSCSGINSSTSCYRGTEKAYDAMSEIGVWQSVSILNDVLSKVEYPEDIASIRDSYSSCKVVTKSV